MKIFTVLFLGMFSAIGFAAGPAASVGWRGDGTGIYPEAHPPVRWGQTSTALAALRTQTTPPKGDAASGKAMTDGVIREWLVLGPLPATKTPKDSTDALFNMDESGLAPPEAGKKVAGGEWKTISEETAYIDFAKLYDTYEKTPQEAVYVAAYVYSPAEASFVINVNHTASGRMWVNGKTTSKAEETELNYTGQMVKFRAGWNTVLLRVTPTGGEGRPINGTWYVNVDLRTAPDEAKYTTQNIAWKTQLPEAGGLGGPIVVGGKVLLLSETAEVVCVDEKSGKILWIRSNNYDECATAEEKAAHADIFAEIEPLEQKLQQINDSLVAGTHAAAQYIDGETRYKDKVDTEKKLYSLMKKVDREKYKLPEGQDVGYSGFTPVSDGKYVWAWFANGVSCCYDLEGKLIWRRLDNEGSFFEHGYSVSPILAGGKFVVFMNNLIAFDAAPGKREWTTNFSGIAMLRFHVTPAAFEVGGTAYCVLPTGQIIRISDGKVVHEKGPEISPRQQEIPSPVAIGNTLYELSTFGFFNRVTLPAAADPLAIVDVKTMQVDLNHFPTYYLDWFLSSPLIDNGLAYCVNNSGVLNVFDLESGQIVYQKLLDLDANQNVHESAGRGIGISPSLAGGNIYLVGNAGATLVIKPGRTYQEVAKNKIESIFLRYWSIRPERFVSAPTFDGGRMFLRGERYLYCIAE